MLPDDTSHGLSVERKIMQRKIEIPLNSGFRRPAIQQNALPKKFCLDRSKASNGGAPQPLIATEASCLVLHTPRSLHPVCAISIANCSSQGRLIVCLVRNTLQCFRKGVVC